MSESSPTARAIALSRGPVGSITARTGRRGPVGSITSRTGRRGPVGWIASRTGRRGLVAVALTVAALAAVTLSGGQAPEPSAFARQVPEGGGDEGNKVGSGPPRQALAYPLARLVPSDALAFASVRDVSESIRRADATGLARTFDDPEVGPFLRNVTARLVDRLAGAVTVMQSLKLAVEGGGEAAFAVLGIDREAGRPEAVFLADVAGRENLVRALLDVLELSALRLARPRRVAVGEATVTSIGPPGYGAWTVHRGLMVAGTSLPAVRGVLERAEAAAGGEVEGALELDRAFTASVARVSLGAAGKPGGDNDYLVYVNIERAAGGLFAAPAADELASAGLEGVRSAALVGRIGGADGASVREAVYLHSPGERGRLLDLLSGPPITLSEAPPAPSRSIMALFGPVMPARDWLAGLAGESGRAERGRGLAKVLGALAGCMEPLVRGEGGGPDEARGGATEEGEACVFLWSVGRVNWLPRLGAVARLAEGEGRADGLADGWAELARALGGRVVEHRIRGAPTPGGKPVNVGVRAIEGMRFRLPFVYSPASCVSGDRLVVTTDAAAARELLLPAEDGLAASERMKRSLGDLPAEKRFVLYVDIPRIVDRGFEPYAPAIIDALFNSAFLRGAGGPDNLDGLDREAMPPGAAIGRHLDAAALSVLSDAEGLRLDAVTPAGLLPTVGAAAWIADVFLSAWPPLPPGPRRAPPPSPEPTPPPEDEETFF